jgi:gamma-glutamyl hydrolase
MRLAAALAALALLAATPRAAAIRPAAGAAVSAALGRRRAPASSSAELNLRPLVGILSQGGDPAPKGSSYIAASYVKFVEAAGARAVPILHDMPPAEVARRFAAVNAVLLPGGSQDLAPGHRYFDAAAQLYDLTLKANDGGDFFPLHGTCLGFEAIAILASGNTSVLSSFDAEDYAQPLYPTEATAGSRFFTGLPRHVAQNLFAQPIAMQNHESGLDFEAVEENAALKEAFEVLTLSADRGERLYVSTMEARRYPITATQWCALL